MAQPPNNFGWTKISVNSVLRRLQGWFLSLKSRFLKWRGRLLHSAVLWISSFVAAGALLSSLMGLLVDGSDLMLWSDRRLPGLLAIALFVAAGFAIAWISQELWNDNESVRNQLDNICKSVEASREDNLARFSSFLIEAKPADIAHILIWRGYEDFFALMQYEMYIGVPEQPVSLSVITYETSEIMPLLFSESKSSESKFARIALRRGIFTDAPEAMVIDHEIFSELGTLKMELLPLPQDIEEKSSLVIPSKLLELYRREGLLLGLPVCYDVNAIAWNRSYFGQGTPLEKFLSEPEVIDKFEQVRIGILDWYLPIMGLFAGPAKNSRPFNLKRADFEALCSAMKAFSDRVEIVLKSSQGRLQFLSPEDLALGLVDGRIHIALGGGGWVGHTGPAARVSNDEITWSIPKEGGLLWLEGLVFPKAKKRTPEQKFGDTHRRMIMKKLLTVEFHGMLAERRMCSGRPALEEAAVNGVTKVAAVSHQGGLAVDSGQFMLDNLGINLALRSYPAEGEGEFVARAEWEAFWCSWKVRLSSFRA